LTGLAARKRTIQEVDGAERPRLIENLESVMAVSGLKPSIVRAIRARLCCDGRRLRAAGRAARRGVRGHCRGAAEIGKSVAVTINAT